ncbi:hypothetical protein [Paraburkholderia xenovorans]|uniref:hypothetical protein n=1 Tax=Paraburkholderia xenovorans TaxID=36873 RepID=UPI0019D9A683|nr:hypothetical protein [Paraburkholderia xenovorans]NPT34270.1 hypothetical protein [Paraburkholderia xenovorans]
MCSPIGLALSDGVFSAQDDRHHSSDCTGALPDPFDLTQGRSVDVNISGRRNGRRRKSAPHEARFSPESMKHVRIK